MKIWSGFGTEHSMNLVMIGRFRNVEKAETVRGIIKKIISAVESEQRAGRLIFGEPADRYSDEVLQLLSDLNIHNIAPSELMQFLYEVDIKRDGDSIVITTDEIDVSALSKVLLSGDARIEMYSAHQYPGEYGRTT